jgi:ribonuclease P protein component
MLGAPAGTGRKSAEVGWGGGPSPEQGLKSKVKSKDAGNGAGGRERASAKEEGFGRERRLLKHSAFDRVYTTGRRQFSPAMTAFYLLQSSQPGEVRIGFTVGRAMGGAVERNRIKRRMREAVRRSLPELRSRLSERRLGAEIVFNPRRKVLEMDFGELQREVARVLQAVSTAPASAGKEQA